MLLNPEGRIIAPTAEHVFVNRCSVKDCLISVHLTIHSSVFDNNRTAVPPGAKIAWACNTAVIFISSLVAGPSKIEK